jgi:hypothetical protein
VSEAPEPGLAERLRAHLAGLPPEAVPVTYAEVAAALGLQPPRTIHRVTVALERLMEEDAAAGRPFLAALVIGRARAGLPAPGYFERAAALGRGPAADETERAAHGREVAAAIAHHLGGGR